jgi:hypothetical protein
MGDLDGNLLVPPDLQARIRQAFLLGLARQPVAPPPSLTAVLPPGSEPALALLALAGQRQRFAGPPPVAADPVPDAARSLHADPRPVLPPEARRALHRLARSVEKTLAGTVLPIALRRVSAAGCRLHPFDLPAFARHFKADAERHGLIERAWIALTASDTDEEAAKGLFFDRITAENWTTFPKAQRRAFVAGLRHTDPAAGRALIEGVWKTEPAPVRAALVEALAVGLGADDKPFLEKLATDRADSVKQIAVRLIARMPETEGFAQRLAAAARCFRRGTGAGRVMAALGLGGADTLTFVPPGGGLNATDGRAVRERLFNDLPLAALAKAVGATVAEIIAAVPDDEFHVRQLLLDQAAAEEDTATVQGIVKTRLFTSQALTGAVVMPIATEARLPLDPGDAAHLVAMSVWKSAVRGLMDDAVPKDDGRLVVMATLMPQEAMFAFVASLSPLPPSAARAASDFADLVLALPAGNVSPEPAS